MPKSKNLDSILSKENTKFNLKEKDSPNNFGIVGIRKEFIMPITDLKDVVKHAKAINDLKSEIEGEIEPYDSWLSQYKLKMDIIKKNEEE